jgi:hypothetical protein
MPVLLKLLLVKSCTRRPRITLGGPASIRPVTIMDGQDSATAGVPRAQPGWVVPSMVTCLASGGRAAEVRVMRMGGAPVRLKWMRLDGSTEAFTSTTAWRSDPGPLSRLFVTVTVNPCACSRQSAAMPIAIVFFIEPLSSVS